MITIDGAAGEGGGQVLRTALGLSLVTGRSFVIKNIRAKRSKPGLMRQHLTAVTAATEIGFATCEGVAIGSGELSFRPGPVRPGSYHFSIGTAGSCTLVFQAILPALLMVDGPSQVTLEGGTHNPMAPPFDFLEQTYLPLLRQMGAELEAQCIRPGFYPAGGGRLEINIRGGRPLQTIELISATKVHLSARSLCAGLPAHIGQRELAVVRKKLSIDVENTEHQQLNQHGPGNTLSIFAHSDQLTETFTGFGEKNVSAERVARRTIGLVNNYLKSATPVGEYLADQLLIPMALAGSGCMRTSRPSNHTLTNIEVIKAFLDVDFTLSQVGANAWQITVSERA